MYSLTPRYKTASANLGQWRIGLNYKRQVNIAKFLLLVSIQEDEGGVHNKFYCNEVVLEYIEF
jgi:hypothetical protein